MSATLPERRVLAPMRAAWGRQTFGRDWQAGWLFLVPLLIVLIGLIAYPFVNAIWLSLQYKMVGQPAEWVGLANYRELLWGAQYSPIFWHSVVVSAIYTVVAILAKLVLGMAMALLLNEKFA